MCARSSVVRSPCGATDAQRCRAARWRLLWTRYVLPASALTVQKGPEIRTGRMKDDQDVRVAVAVG